MASTIYHLVDAQVWREACDQLQYRPASLATEGFVHFSELGQVEATAARFYATTPSLLILEVDVAKLRAELRYELADGQRFPHLYGTLDRAAVIRVEAMERDASGHYRLPAGF